MHTGILIVGSALRQAAKVTARAAAILEVVSEVNAARIERATLQSPQRDGAEALIHLVGLGGRVHGQPPPTDPAGGRILKKDIAGGQILSLEGAMHDSQMWPSLCENSAYVIIALFDSTLPA